MEQRNEIHRKIILLRNLLFLYYNVPIHEITRAEVGDESFEYFTIDSMEYETKDFPLLHDTITIEREFCEAKDSNTVIKRYVSRDSLMKLNGIYQTIKNHESVIKYIKENGNEN